VNLAWLWFLASILIHMESWIVDWRYWRHASFNTRDTCASFENKQRLSPNSRPTDDWPTSRPSEILRMTHIFNFRFCVCSPWWPPSSRQSHCISKVERLRVVNHASLIPLVRKQSLSCCSRFGNLCVYVNYCQNKDIALTNHCNQREGSKESIFLFCLIDFCANQNSGSAEWYYKLRWNTPAFNSSCTQTLKIWSPWAGRRFTGILTYRRFITQSRWGKFMAWKDPEMEACQTIFYFDGH
jgi:hypothetical protein